MWHIIIVGIKELLYASSEPNVYSLETKKGNVLQT